VAEALIQLELCAPERAKSEMSATEIIVPGEGGVFTVLPGHTPILSTLLPGVVQAIDEAGETHFFAVSGGFAEVKENCVTILAEAFEFGKEIDFDRAQAAQERAEKRLKRSADDIAVARAERSLTRALARIDAHKKRMY
jgi:F-type H+-transporting ATPase subunit epsilon